MIKIGKYELCFLDYFVDSQGKLSATKFWFHVGNIILSKAILEKSDLGWEDILSYGAIVGGSHVAVALLKLKFGGGNASIDDTNNK